jgi:hypothetical protein
MAKNLLGGDTKINFARGTAPPADSYEWAASGPPPKKTHVKKPVTATVSPAGKKIPVVVATMTARETIIIEKKPKKWRYLGIGALVGGVATYLGIKIHSY